MKKYILQIVTIWILVVLLVVCIKQGNQLKEYQELIDSQLYYLQYDLKNEINNVANLVVAAMQGDTQPTEATQPTEDDPILADDPVVDDLTVEVYNINTDEWMLEAVATVTLNRWTSNAAVTLLASVNGETLSMPLEKIDGNCYAAHLSLPLETPNDMLFTVQIEEYGNTIRRPVRAWVGTLQLLPAKTWGGEYALSFDPDNGEATFTLYVQMRDESGAQEHFKILDPAFTFYKNGELFATVDAVRTSDWNHENECRYDIDSKDREWSMQVEPGDRVVVCFSFHGEDGLGYEFYLVTYEAEVGDMNYMMQEDEPDFRLFRAK